MNSLSPMTVIELFEKLVEERQEQEALFFLKDDTSIYTSLSWNKYRKKVRKFSRAVISMGVEPYKTINILGHNSPEWFIAFLGGIYAACPPVGVYPTNSESAVMYIAAHSECGLLIVDDILNFKKYDLKSLKNLKGVVIYSDISEKDLKSLINPYVPVYTWKDFISLGKKALVDFEFSARINMQSPGNCCNLIYTSGTTGNPKGVMLSHDNLTWTARTMKIQYGDSVGEEGRLVSFLPLSHIAAQIVDIFCKNIGI